MERQLQGLLGDGSAGASGATGHGPSGSQPQQGATRQSGRARQRRDLSEAAIEEARRRQWDAVFSDNGVAEAEGEDEEAEGADAGGEGGAGGGSTGLLVCGFSRDGTHIVAGGNDCSVYVWQWEVPPAADAAQQQQQRAASLPGKGSSRSAVTGALAGQATAAAAALPTGLEAAGQLQAEGGACEPAAMETTPEAAAVEAAGPSAAAQPLGGSLLADPPAADERQQHAQPLPAVQQQGQQGGRQAQRQRVAGAAYPASPLGAEDAPWPAPKEVCQLKGHRNDVILLQFSHAGDRAATGSKDGSVRVRWPRSGAALCSCKQGDARRAVQHYPPPDAAMCFPPVPAFLAAPDPVHPRVWCALYARPLPPGVAPPPAVAEAGTGLGAGGDLCCAARPRGHQGGPAAAAPPARALRGPDCLERGRPAVRGQAVLPVLAGGQGSSAWRLAVEWCLLPFHHNALACRGLVWLVGGPGVAVLTSGQQSARSQHGFGGTLALLHAVPLNFCRSSSPASCSPGLLASFWIWCIP